MPRALTGETLVKIGPQGLADIVRTIGTVQLEGDESESQVGAAECCDLCSEIAEVFSVVYAHSGDILRAAKVVAYAGVCVGYAIRDAEIGRRRRVVGTPQVS